MKNSIFLKSVISGMSQGIIFYVLNEFFISICAQELLLNCQLMICGVGAIALALIYFLFICMESDNKKIIKFALLDTLWSIFSLIVVFVIYQMFSFHLFPIRQINEADGILLLVTNIVSILLPLILKSIIFLIVITKNICKKRETKTQGDGSSVSRSDG